MGYSDFFNIIIIRTCFILVHQATEAEEKKITYKTFQLKEEMWYNIIYFILQVLQTKASLRLHQRKSECLRN